jgi:cytochrome c biogenesis protein CcdA
MYFLGLEGSRPDSSQRASLIRALKVSAAVSSGFIAVFLVVGIITRAFTSVIADNAKYAGFVVGIMLIVMGIAMFFGWKPNLVTPQITAKRDNTVPAMLRSGIHWLHHRIFNHGYFVVGWKAWLCVRRVEHCLVWSWHGTVGLIAHCHVGACQGRVVARVA